uniref:ATP synthase subunit a n=1 Tax=Epanerchodus koreanus TaxID=2678661 RepID=A0A7L8HYY9_9MYRI|nr:ATP synthase F0 subunit 6 [Epanerchodus koreanus]QOE55893.1 ATP synthase F0 subunit 6 [Epanerchodus koreanus]
MMMSLFSVFDPSTIFMSLNWFSMIIWLVIFPGMYWVMSSRFFGFLNFLVKFLLEEFLSLIGLSSGYGIISLIIGVFIFIMMNNVFGLVSYVFTSTAHFVVSISLALPLWIGLMLYGWINNMMHMFIHLVPMGTPGALLVFMVIVESISMLIRPLTLSVRLGANMIAGHLLMVLLGGLSSGLEFMGLIVVFGQMMLLVLEIAVAFIQAYVFCTLFMLYYEEVN